MQPTRMPFCGSDIAGQVTADNLNNIIVHYYIHNGFTQIIVLQNQKLLAIWISR